MTDYVKPTERDHRNALASNLERIGRPAYAEGVRKLPVIATCGECKHCTGPADETWCDLEPALLDVDSADRPPEWCKLRGQ